MLAIAIASDTYTLAAGAPSNKCAIVTLHKYKYNKYAHSARPLHRSLTSGHYLLKQLITLLPAWEVVTHQYAGYRLNWFREWLDRAAIKSHGDAIHYLRLSSQVVRPISLQQIRMEQKFLQYVPT